MVDASVIAGRIEQKLVHINGLHTINPHTGIVDVVGNVIVQFSVQQKLPMQFGKVTGNFNCAHLGITTLEGSPHWVGGKFECRGNRLTSLQHAPTHVAGRFYCESNYLKSLDGAPDFVGDAFVLDWSMNLPLLRTCQAHGGVIFREQGSPVIVEQILNRYAGQGKHGALKAALELIKAGYRENARW